MSTDTGEIYRRMYLCAVCSLRFVSGPGLWCLECWHPAAASTMARYDAVPRRFRNWGWMRGRQEAAKHMRAKLGEFEA